MISNHFPEDYTRPITEQVVLGEYSVNYSKSILFNPNTVREINYSIGAHEASPQGYADITTYTGEGLKLLHYKNLGFNYRYSKNSKYGETLSSYNKANKWGWHYNMSQDEQLSEFSELFKGKHIVIEDHPTVSFTITTCGRLDLLDRTLNSFFELCKFPFSEYLMTEDSGDESVYQSLVEKWGDKFRILQNSPKIGLCRSIDRLWTEASSEYVFHCEDDWLFDSNPMLIEDSLSILREHSTIHQVQVRHVHDNPHKPENETYTTLKFVDYKHLPWWRDAWTGYSWNPGLRRIADYRHMFPNGVQEYGDEIECSKHSMSFGYSAVVLKETACSHIGYDRHTENFII